VWARGTAQDNVDCYSAATKQLSELCNSQLMASSQRLKKSADLHSFLDCTQE